MEVVGRTPLKGRRIIEGRPFGVGPKIRAIHPEDGGSGTNLDGLDILLTEIVPLNSFKTDILRTHLAYSWFLSKSKQEPLPLSRSFYSRVADGLGKVMEGFGRWWFGNFLYRALLRTDFPGILVRDYALDRLNVLFENGVEIPTYLSGEMRRLNN